LDTVGHQTSAVNTDIVAQKLVDVPPTDAGGPPAPNPLLEAALRYADLGWHVFPLAPQRKIPPKGSHGCKEATTDTTKIRAWWEEQPRANIGIATGEKTGFWVLDIDPRHGGDDALADLEATHGNLPASVEAITGGRGRHILFTAPFPPRNNNDGKAVAPGIDVRTNGGYIVAAPSIHPNGMPYEWEAASNPLDGTVIVAAPSWLTELIEAAHRRQGDRHQTAGRSSVAEVVTEGSRNTTLTSYAGKLRRVGANEEDIYQCLITRNHAICRPPLPDHEVRTIAKSIKPLPQR
jgi:putative DNA primase/helicase